VDQRLKIPPRGASSRLLGKVCEANRAGSFDKAVRHLQTLADMPISAKRAQLITGRAGALLREQRNRTTAPFLSGDYKEPPPASAPLLISDGGSGIIESTVK